jgi:hypothetical protein
MQDLQARVEKLETEAAECDLIAKLAVDGQKRAAFEGLAVALRREAGILGRFIDEMSSRATDTSSD